MLSTPIIGHSRSRVCSCIVVAIVLIEIPANPVSTTSLFGIDPIGDGGSRSQRRHYVNSQQGGFAVVVNDKNHHQQPERGLWETFEDLSSTSPPRRSLIEGLTRGYNGLYLDSGRTYHHSDRINPYSAAWTNSVVSTTTTTDEILAEHRPQKPSVTSQAVKAPSISDYSAAADGRGVSDRTGPSLNLNRLEYAETGSTLQQSMLSHHAKSKPTSCQNVIIWSMDAEGEDVKMAVIGFVVDLVEAEMQTSGLNSFSVKAMERSGVFATAIHSRSQNCISSRLVEASTRFTFEIRTKDRADALAVVMLLLRMDISAALLDSKPGVCAARNGALEFSLC